MVEAALNPELAIGWHVGTQRRRLVLLAILAVLASLIYAVLVLALQLVSVVVLLTCIVVVSIAWRPLVGLCMAFGLVLLFAFWALGGLRRAEAAG